MSKTTQLWHDGYELYIQSKYREAAITFLQASDMSRELHDIKNWYKNVVWAAGSFVLAEEYIKAMDLLLDARLHEPEDRPSYEAYLSKKFLFSLTESINPSYDRLNELLNELRNIPSEEQIAPADIKQLEGELYELQGKFKYALDCFEEAWHQNNGYGYVDYTHAIGAADSCIKLGLVTQALDWISASSETKYNYNNRLYEEAILHLKISLVNQISSQTLLQELREVENYVIVIQNRDSQDDFNDLRTRVMLLATSTTDPLTKSHPAKQAIGEKLLNHKKLDNQFKRRLLLLDFRLASLRYYVGMDAVDDLYYTKKQTCNVKPIPFKIKEAKKRISRAIITASNAKKYGEKIDKNLECSMRKEEVDKRLERIYEIRDFYLN